MAARYMAAPAASAASNHQNFSPAASPPAPSRPWRRQRALSPGGRPSYAARAWQWLRTRRSGAKSSPQAVKGLSTTVAPSDKGLAYLNVDAGEVLAHLEMKKLDTFEVLVIDYVEAHRPSASAARDTGTAAIYQAYTSQDGSLYGSCLLKTTRQNHFKSRSTQTKKMHVEEISDKLADLATWSASDTRGSRRYTRLRIPLSESVDFRGRPRNYLLAYENPSRRVKAVYVKIFSKEADAFLEPRLSQRNSTIIV